MLEGKGKEGKGWKMGKGKRGKGLVGSWGYCRDWKDELDGWRRESRGVMAEAGDGTDASWEICYLQTNA